MSDPVYHGGGFGGSARAGLSEGLSIRLAAVEQLEAAEDAKREQERKRRAEAFEERAFQAAIAQAIADGENVNPRLAMQGRGIGHQPHEFVAMISERMDLEDQRLEAVQHREFLRWQAEQSASTSGDTTAPSSLKLEEGAAIRLGRTSTWTVSGRGRWLSRKLAGWLPGMRRGAIGGPDPGREGGGAGVRRGRRPDRVPDGRRPDWVWVRDPMTAGDREAAAGQLRRHAGVGVAAGRDRGGRFL